MRENIHVKSRREDLGARSQRISNPLRRPCNGRDKSERRSRYDGQPGQPDDRMGRKEIIPKAPTARPTLTSCLVDLRHPMVPHAHLRYAIELSRVAGSPIPSALPRRSETADTIQSLPRCWSPSRAQASLTKTVDSNTVAPFSLSPCLLTILFFFHFCFSLPSLSHDDVSSCGNYTSYLII